MASIKTFFRRSPLIIVLVIVAIAVWQRSAVADWVKLRGYNPPANISQLATEDTMTPSATHIYYINHPELVSSNDQFAKDCTQLEQTIVLGCYHSGEDGIFLKSVSDSRLNGVEEVTAAHEMLHGAYERLSQKDKSYVNGLLMDFYKNDLHDQRLLDTINSYKTTEPNDVVDEMHSVFGTEVQVLPPPLEAYYKQYFFNRAAVANFAAGYQAEFTSRLDKIKNYESQLNSLKTTIGHEESALDSQSSQLQSDRASLESLRNSGQFAEYNSRVATFNQEVGSYNAGVEQLKSDINAYNSIVELHNQLADEIRGLYSSLGTSLAPQTSQ